MQCNNYQYRHECSNKIEQRLLLDVGKTFEREKCKWLRVKRIISFWQTVAPSQIYKGYGYILQTPKWINPSDPLSIVNAIYLFHVNTHFEVMVWWTYLRQMNLFYLLGTTYFSIIILPILKQLDFYYKVSYIIFNYLIKREQGGCISLYKPSIIIKTLRTKMSFWIQEKNQNQRIKMYKKIVWKTFFRYLASFSSYEWICKLNALISKYFKISQYLCFLIILKASYMRNAKK